MVVHEYNWFKVIGCIFSGAVTAASNINVAHELFHKEHSDVDSFFGCLTMSRNLYMHFYIEHLHGHHKNVATPNDPASAKLN
jgi:alkane 1-monooxygenase